MPDLVYSIFRFQVGFLCFLGGFLAGFFNINPDHRQKKTIRGAGVGGGCMGPVKR